MLKALPHVLTNETAFAPLLDMLRGVMLTAADVGERYGYSDEHLCTLRKNGRGWPYIRLQTGGIRYRASDIIAAELRGTTGPLTLERVNQALATCESVSLKDRAAMQAHLRAAFGAW